MIKNVAQVEDIPEMYGELNLGGVNSMGRSQMVNSSVWAKHS